MPSGRTKISPKSGRGLGHVTPTIFGSTVGYPSDSLASCCTKASVFWMSLRSPINNSFRVISCMQRHQYLTLNLAEIADFYGEIAQKDFVTMLRVRILHATLVEFDRDGGV